jgi:hypothetical protein
MAAVRCRVSIPENLSMVLKLSKSAERQWLKLRGAEMIAKVITSVQFKNGIEVQQAVRQEMAA